MLYHPETNPWRKKNHQVCSFRIFSSLQLISVKYTKAITKLKVSWATKTLLGVSVFCTSKTYPQLMHLISQCSWDSSGQARKYRRKGWSGKSLPSTERSSKFALLCPGWCCFYECDHSPSSPRHKLLQHKNQFHPLLTPSLPANKFNQHTETEKKLTKL